MFALILNNQCFFDQNQSFSLCELVPKVLKQLEKTGETPGLYGNSESFDELKREAIQKLVKNLLDMRRDSDNEEMVDSSSNYLDILKKAAKLRHDIAIKTETPEAENFGFSRENLDPTSYMHTTLYAAEYKDINEKIKALILDSFSKIKNRDKGMRVTDGISRYTFRLMQDRGVDFLSTITQNDANRNHEIFFSMMLLDTYKEEMKPIRNKIQGVKQTENEKMIYRFLPDKNLCVYSGRIEILSNKKWHCLTTHYGIIDCNDAGEVTEENIRDFKLHGFVTLFHTHHQNFKFHEPSMVELFNKILNVNTDEEVRKVVMREFEYRLHHMVYFKRGGKAIAEMIIESLKIVCSPQYEPKGHLEALAEPFLKRYMK